MGHKISQQKDENGKVFAEMAYAGRKPWHGLGVDVPALMTTEEALVASHTDWEVEKVQCLSAYDLSPIEGKFATVRTDTGAPLGVVGSVYEPVQNSDAFKFMDTILGNGQAQIETVGALKGGKVVWALAKLPESFEAVQGDEVNPYLLVSNSHDGSSPLLVTFTTIRVVCWNTLSASINRTKKNQIRLRHTTSIADQLEIAALTMSGAIEHFDEMRGVVKQLAKTSVSRVEVGAFLDAMFPEKMRKVRGEERFEKIEDKSRAKVEELLETGMGADIKGVQGTAWGLYNGFTEWLDHHADTRGGLERFDRSQLGKGVDMRQKAFNHLTSLI